ncbi:hypothetical protein COO91_06124 [Nostoc flagelliforme CCNUN1]|uniref:Uncharacterized protein n=1 Tax=Nostoc flagelliforme CCNUN1 TaxID=2038116 RepID=A0A2K8SXF8_9NOSO|nr:hypothetical protein [Nostoc flagelliforme]AUB40124.1 hypothetical protein COO91_06124 [Nostoc flagelliforme CCNUN1]
MLATALIQFWGVALILKFPDMCLKATESTTISQIFNLELWRSHFLSRLTIDHLKGTL